MDDLCTGDLCTAHSKVFPCNRGDYPVEWCVSTTILEMLRHHSFIEDSW